MYHCLSIINFPTLYQKKHFIKYLFCFIFRIDIKRKTIMQSIGYFTYLNEKDRASKHDIFQRYDLSTIIELPHQEQPEDLRVFFTQKFSHAHKIYFYSLSDLPEFFDKVINILETASTYHLKLHFILENITIDDKNYHTILNILKYAKNYKRMNGKRMSKQDYELLDLYLEEGKYSVAKIAQMCGISIASAYLRRQNIKKRKNVDQTG